jgi:hypothetical protein
MRSSALFPALIPAAALAALLMMTPLLGGCGYSLQTSRTSALAREGVRKVYVAPIINNSYKPGVENLLYNELIRSLASNRRVTIVHDELEADAVLGATVTNAVYSVTAGTSSNSLFPTDRKTIEVTVATEYQAILSCDLKLTRTRAVPPVLTGTSGGFRLRPSPTSAAGATLWQSAFSRTKRFPGNNQKDEFGTTSPLINESEFDRALRDIAAGMMGDVHESMLAMF